MLHQAVRLLFLATLGCAHANASVPRIASYMDCARAVGVALNEKLAVIPSDRAGERGLFVYTDHGAYFLALGAPAIDKGDAAEFFLRTSLPAAGDVFLIFRDRSEHGNARILPAIGYHSRVPAGDMRESYRYTHANDALGERAMDAMRRRLVEKIATVRDFLIDKHRYSPPAEARAAFAADHAAWLARLARCRIDGDNDLGVAVSDEERKLAPGFNAATIWEKQVGGRVLAEKGR